MRNLINALCMNVHAARTATDDPVSKYKFKVTIPGIPTTMGFQKVGGLSQEVGVVEYEEGITSHTHKLPGKEKVGEVTLERGVYSSTEFSDMVKQSLTNISFRKTITIQQLNRFGTVVRTWKLAEAWASKWEGSDLDATSEDVAIEKVTIQFEYYTE